MLIKYLQIFFFFATFFFFKKGKFLPNFTEVHSHIEEVQDFNLTIFICIIFSIFKTNILYEEYVKHIQILNMFYLEFVNMKLKSQKKTYLFKIRNKKSLTNFSNVHSHIKELDK